MANLNSVLSQIAQQQDRIEAKLDVLLEKEGIEFKEPERLLESPKPTKTYVNPPKADENVSTETAAGGDAGEGEPTAEDAKADEKPADKKPAAKAKK